MKIARIAALIAAVSCIGFAVVGCNKGEGDKPATPEGTPVAPGGGGAGGGASTGQAKGGASTSSSPTPSRPSDGDNLQFGTKAPK